MAAKYTQPPDNRETTHYVKAFGVGVVEEKVTLTYYRGMVNSKNSLDIFE